MTATIKQALEYIHSFDDPYLAALRNHGKQTWGLAGIRMMLAKLGNPHVAYPTIHVAGTKGKGSTAAFIAQGLIESGLKVGLYTSPHLEDWQERIQVNRELITEDALVKLVNDFKPHVEDMPLSAFEVTTALAFWHFACSGCDVAVIEVGLGGRLDATSIVQPLAAVITSISMDHMQLLGDTLAEIAGEKAAIIKPSTPVISAPQKPEALAVIEARAAELNSPLTLIGRDWTIEITGLTWEGTGALIGDRSEVLPYIIGLPGTFQAENAAAALAALHQAAQAGLPVTSEGMTAGLANVRWPGRCEVVQKRPLVVLDSAHNPYSMRRLVETLTILSGEMRPRPRLHIVFGCMGDKDIDGMLEAILPAASCVTLTSAQHSRAATVEDLERRARTLIAQARAQGQAWAETITLNTAGTMPEAIHTAHNALTADDVLCITGSLAIAGEARRHMALASK